MRPIRLTTSLVLLGLAVLGATGVRADGPGLVYGGRLTDAQGAPLAGPVDLTVRFFRAATGGDPVGPTLTLPGTPLAQGVFQVTLPLAATDDGAIFGDGSEAVWVEVEASARTYPRQRFGVVPYALRVAVDGQTVSFNGAGQLSVGPTSVPGANQFLTKDSGGHLVWGTPSTNATGLAGAALAVGTPTPGAVLKYVGGQWTGVADTGVNRSGDAGLGSLVLAPQATLGLGTFAGHPGTLAAADAGKTWYDTTAGEIEYWDGSSVKTLGVSGAGLQSLNGATGNVQTFTVPGVAGLSPGWVTNGAANTHTLNIPLASASGVTGGLLANADYQAFQGKVSKSGDAMTGNLTTTGSVGIGTLTPATALDLTGVLTERGVVAPAASGAGQGRLYFDQSAGRFFVSENGGAYATLVTGSPVTAVAAGNGLSGGGSSGSVTLSLASVGASGTYTKVLTDAFGRVTAGTTLAFADLPPLSITAAQVTGTLLPSQIASLPAGQITGTFAVAQIPSLPPTQIAGTLAAAQLPPLSQAQITSGTLAVALGGTGATSFTGNGVVVGGGAGPLSATAAGTAYQVLTVNGSNQPVFGALNLGQASAVTGTLAVTNGGTGSNATLAGNRVMVSAGSAIVEAPALTNGQLLIGSTGSAPAVATLSPGASQGVTIVAGPGALTLDTVQDIRTSAAPQFSGLKLSSPSVGSLLKVGTGGSLTAAAAADVTGLVAGTYVQKTGDSMTGPLALAANGLVVGGNQLVASGGNLGVGTTSPGTALDVVGALTERGMTAPSVAPSGQGRLYFDSATGQFLVSQNGSAYTPLSLGGLSGVTAGAGLTGGGSSGSATLALPSLGAAGTYVKVTTDAFGRVTAGSTLTAADLPPHSASLLTSGTVGLAQLPAIPVTQLAGTLAAAQVPILPVTQLSGTLAASQIAAAGAAGQIQFNNLGALGASPGLAWDNVNGRLGVGTLSPGSKLHVMETRTDTAAIWPSTQAVALTASPASTSSANFLSGYFTAATGSNQNVSGLWGLLGTASNANTATVANVIGIQGNAYNNTTGVVTTAAGGDFYPNNGSTGTITNAFGVTTSVYNTGGGTVTNGYGVNIGGVAGTNHWSLYASDAASPSYFAGSVGIGTVSPARPLHVNGAMRLTPSTVPASPSAGDLYIDSSDNTLRYYDGSGWKVPSLSPVAPVPATRIPTGLTAADVLNHLVLNGDLTDTGTNAAGTSLTGALAYVSGPFGYAATGFSTNNYVSLTRVTISSYTATGFTACAWIKGTDTSAQPTAYESANNVFGDTTNFVWWGLGVTNGKASIGAGTAAVISSTASVADGNWHHVAYVFTYSGGTWTGQIYVDGNADGTGALQTGGNAYYAVNALGKTAATYAQGYGYRVDNAYVFDKALTAAQVAELY